MKAKEIMLHISRSLGNYEFAKMSVTYEINEGDDVIDSFKSAQLEINEAFDALFPDYNAGSYVEKSSEIDHDNETTIKKQPLMIDDEKFLKIKKRIMNGTLKIEDVEKYYELGEHGRNILMTIEKLKEL